MISDKYKSVFIHYPKTAGESITSALTPTLEPKAGRKHLTAIQVKNAFGQEKWEKYFKFSIVRNPWDRAVSWYFHLRKKGDLLHPLNACQIARKCSFLEFCKIVLRDNQVQEEEARAGVRHFIPFCEWASDEGGNIILDFVGRFENLNNDFAVICKKIGIPRQVLPHSNGSKHKNYIEYYDDETRKIVEEKYAKDIEYFDYKFGD